MKRKATYLLIFETQCKFIFMLTLNIFRSRHRRSDSGSVRRDRRFGHPVAQLQQQSLREDGGGTVSPEEGCPCHLDIRSFRRPSVPQSELTMMCEMFLF